MRKLPGLILLALVPACVTTVGNGKLATETRDVATFKEVTNAIMVDAVIRVDDTRARNVEITCDSNLLDQILTEVQDGRLVLKTPPNVILTTDEDCRADIRMPSLLAVAATGSGDVFVSGAVDELYSVDNNGSGDVHVANIDVDELRLGDTGSGDIDVDGSCDTVNIWNSGSGNIDARDLDAIDATVLNSGSGKVLVCASGTCDATLTGSGDIDVYGDPDDVNETNTGSGTIEVF